ASFVNMGAVVRWLASERPDSVYVACAGTEGRFSLDDALVAGCLIARYGAQAPCSLSDAAAAAKAMYERHAGDLAAGLESAAHARKLISLGFEEDVRFAARVDALDVVPLRKVDGRACIENGGGL